MLYEINSKKIFKLIGVPNEIVSYINELDEISLKTLILIFSENGTLSKFDISKKLKKTISEIDLAFKVLENKNIIKILNDDETIVREIVEAASPFQIDAGEMKSLTQNDKSMKMLFEEAEKIYARPLNFIEKRTLSYIVQTFNLQIDAILMAIEFCVRNQKSINQIEKLCERWSNSGIITHEQAEQQIKILTKQKDIESKIKKCFGIYGRSLSENEKNYVLKWTRTYGFNIFMIKEAFNRCVDSTGSLSFRYIEGILCNWNKNKINSLRDLKEADSKYINLRKTKNSTNKNSQQNKISENSSYNLKMLLQSSRMLMKEELKRMGRL